MRRDRSSSPADSLLDEQDLALQALYAHLASAEAGTELAPDSKIQRRTLVACLEIADQLTRQNEALRIAWQRAEKHSTGTNNGDGRKSDE